MHPCRSVSPSPAPHHHEHAAPFVWAKVRLQPRNIGGDDASTPSFFTSPNFARFSTWQRSTSSTRAELSAPSSLVPPAGCCHSMTVFDGRFLLLFGGGSARQISNRLFVFDVVSSTWRDMAIQHTSSTIAPRLGHSAVVDGDCLIIYGGQDVHHISMFCDVQMLSLRTWRWRSLGEAPREPFGPGGRRLHTSHIHRGEMFVVLGEPNTSDARVWAMTLKKATRHVDADAANRGSCDVVGDEFGWRHRTDFRSRHRALRRMHDDDDDDEEEVEVEEEMDGSRWRVVGRRSPLQPPPLAGHSSVLHHAEKDDARLLVFGGYRADILMFEYSNELYCLHMATEMWSQVSLQPGIPRLVGCTWPVIRNAASMVVDELDGRIYLYGGDAHMHGETYYRRDYWQMELITPPSSSSTTTTTTSPLYARWLPIHQHQRTNTYKVNDDDDEFEKDEDDDGRVLVDVGRPRARSGCSAVLLHRTLYLFGGEREGLTHGGLLPQTTYSAALYRCRLGGAASIHVSLRDGLCRWLTAAIICPPPRLTTSTSSSLEQSVHGHTNNNNSSPTSAVPPHVPAQYVWLPPRARQMLRDYLPLDALVDR